MNQNGYNVAMDPKKSPFPISAAGLLGPDLVLNASVKITGNFKRPNKPVSTETCSFGPNETAHLTGAFLKNRSHGHHIERLCGK